MIIQKYSGAYFINKDYTPMSLGKLQHIVQVYELIKNHNINYTKLLDSGVMLHNLNILW